MPAGAIRAFATAVDAYCDANRDGTTRSLLRSTTTGSGLSKAWRTAAQSHVGPASSFESLKGFVLAAYNSGLRSGKLEW